MDGGAGSICLARRGAERTFLSAAEPSGRASPPIWPANLIVSMTLHLPLNRRSCVAQPAGFQLVQPETTDEQLVTMTSKAELPQEIRLVHALPPPGDLAWLTADAGSPGLRGPLRRTSRELASLSASAARARSACQMNVLFIASMAVVAADPP
jgi:hypothetical protein